MTRSRVPLNVRAKKCSCVSLVSPGKSVYYAVVRFDAKLQHLFSGIFFHKSQSPLEMLVDKCIRPLEQGSTSSIRIDEEPTIFDRTSRRKKCSRSAHEGDAEVQWFSIVNSFVLVLLVAAVQMLCDLLCLKGLISVRREKGR